MTEDIPENGNVCLMVSDHASATFLEKAWDRKAKSSAYSKSVNKFPMLQRWAFRQKIPVLSLSSFIKLLDELRFKGPTTRSKGFLLRAPRKAKRVAEKQLELKEPFVKFESLDRLYRPETCELKQKPVLWLLDRKLTLPRKLAHMGGYTYTTSTYTTVLLHHCVITPPN